MNPDEDELTRLRRILAANMGAAPDATRTPAPEPLRERKRAAEAVARQRVPTMSARVSGAPESAPLPSKTERALETAAEFVPGFSEGMGIRRMVDAATGGRTGDAAVEGAALAAGLLPLGKPANKLIRAFHGSPWSFRGFLDKHLLSGEGNMARGAGHYLATLKREAIPYRKPRGSVILDNQILARPNNIVSGATEEARAALEAGNILEVVTTQLLREKYRDAGRLDEILNNDIVYDAARRNLINSDESYARAIERAMQRGPGAGMNNIAGSGEGGRAFNDQVTELLKSRRVQENPGSLYEVGVTANPARLLDWNSPIEGQPDFTRGVLRNTTSPELREAVASAPVRSNNAGDGPLAGDVVTKLEDLFLPPHMFAAEAAKRGGYKKIRAEAQVKARDILRDEGLEYTRYTPMGGKTARGRHLIVYDPERIRILRVLAAAGVVGAQEELAQMEQASRTPEIQ